ncbi:MAG: hypothetical protein AAGF87_14810, partial [Bacteroidota bacterium]
MKYLAILLYFVSYTIIYSQYDCTVYSNSSENLSEQSSCNTIKLTTSEILAFPSIEIKLAFHFEEDQFGNNFTCDPNDPIISQNWFLYAPNLVNAILDQMNLRMSEGLLLDGDNGDMGIRFSAVDGGDCGSGIFLYEEGESFLDVDNAMDIRFVNLPDDPGQGGWTTFGGQTIWIRNVLEVFLGGGNNFWDLARTLNHEFGHTRNLNHSFFCGNPCNGIDMDSDAECCGTCVPQPFTGSGCFGCTEDNLTMGYGTQLNFTECELLEIWTYMINNPEPFQHFDLCESTEEDIEIVFNSGTYEVWNHNKSFNKDVRISGGTIIEIQCSVLMGEGKRIIVDEGAKLIVNGGRITNLCDNLWSGIRVYGGNADFDVKFTNDAIIENTNAPAVSMFAPESWPEIQQWGNGILIAENSIFNNTKRIVEFMSWSPLPNNSYITDCVQNGGKWSITNWNCQG